MRIFGWYVTLSRRNPDDIEDEAFELGRQVAFQSGMDLQRRLDSYELGQAYGRGYDDAKRDRSRQVQRWRILKPVPGPAQRQLRAVPPTASDEPA